MCKGNTLLCTMLREIVGVFAKRPVNIVSEGSGFCGWKQSYLCQVPCQRMNVSKLSAAHLEVKWLGS